jgi:apolipoprotein N-acyltransferase
MDESTPGPAAPATGIRRRILDGAGAVGAGGACALAFAPYDLQALAPVSMVALFHLWSRASPARGFRLGYLFGIGLFGAGVNWLHISINLFGGLGLPAALAVTFLLIAYLALFPALAGYASVSVAAAPAIGAIVSWPAIWVLTEWARTWMFTGFPWLLLGYSQIDSPLGALAPLIGVLGVGWATTFAAGVVLALIHAHGRGRITCVAGLLLLIAVSLLAGRAHWTRETGGRHSVALVQGAVPLAARWRPELLDQSVERYVTLTGPFWDSNIIIWPETAIPAFASQVPDLLRLLTAEAGRRGNDMYAGFPILEPDTGRYYNGLLLLGPRPQVYRKRHLVPFGEYTPFASVLRGFAELMNIPMSNFSPGEKSPPLLNGIHGRSGVSICYEDTFGDEIIEALPEAELLINVSNDGWFGDSAAPHQHLQMARMRARETGRYLLRATNSGISAIIAPDGAVAASAPQFEPRVVTGHVSLFTGATPYARFGNWPVVLLAFAAACASLFRRRRKPGTA